MSARIIEVVEYTCDLCNNITRDEKNMVLENYVVEDRVKNVRFGINIDMGDDFHICKICAKIELDKYRKKL